MITCAIALTLVTVMTVMKVVTTTGHQWYQYHFGHHEISRASAADESLSAPPCTQSSCGMRLTQTQLRSLTFRITVTITMTIINIIITVLITVITTTSHDSNNLPR